MQLECSESLARRGERLRAIWEQIELHELALVMIVRATSPTRIHSEFHQHLCAGIEQICLLLVVVLGIVGPVEESVFYPLRLWQHFFVN